MLVISLLLACGESKKIVTDHSMYCQEDPESTLIAEDGDCDGVLTADDCDDADENSTIVSEDGDCDGALTAEDCDDADENSTIVSEDGDCDGALTAEDCNDADENSTIVSEDEDCDGVLTADDCDDNDALVYPGATDQWYDGIDSDCMGNNDYDQDEDGDGKQGEAYCSIPGYTTSGTCASAGGSWELGYDCNDTNSDHLSLAKEDDSTACYLDADQDGYGDNDLSSSLLSQGLINGTDCDDLDIHTFPGAGYNEASPIDELCLQDMDGDGYAASVPGTCFDFSFSSYNNTLTVPFWPSSARTIDVLVDGDLFVSKSSGGEVCVESGKGFVFQYNQIGSTSSSNLSASITWSKPNLHSSSCFLFQNTCTSEYTVSVISPNDMYYNVLEAHYLNGQEVSADYGQSMPLFDGDTLYSGTALGPEDIYGTDSDDSNSAVH